MFFPSNLQDANTNATKDVAAMPSPKKTGKRTIHQPKYDLPPIITYPLITHTRSSPNAPSRNQPATYRSQLKKTPNPTCPPPLNDTKTQTKPIS